MMEKEVEVKDSGRRMNSDMEKYKVAVLVLV